MKHNIKIVRTDLELECPLVDQTFKSKGYELVLLPDNVDEETLLRETQEADLLLMCYRQISAEVIANATKLKGIVKYGVGIDAIDIDAAIQHKVPVVNIPEYAEETVAEGAFTIMLALAKKLIPIHNQMRDHGWAWPTQAWLGYDLAEKTIGLIGTGKIARSFARMAGAGFRANVLGFDPNVDAEIMQDHGIIKTDNLLEMLSKCDFVSIHAVLNESTHHLIGTKELSIMKNSSILINASRGAVVDEMALLTALKNKEIAGAGLDVFSKEPLNQIDHPLQELYKMDNVILFPHLTFYTKEAMERLEIETLERSFEILEGGPVQIKSKDPRLLKQSSGVVFQ